MPMFKIWLGPLPVTVLFHSDTVEVSVLFISFTIMQIKLKLLVSILSV